VSVFCNFFFPSRNGSVKNRNSGLTLQSFYTEKRKKEKINASEKGETFHLLCLFRQKFLFFCKIIHFLERINLGIVP
jgi:hypothetical protein